jgi:hypothetical protein
MPRPRQDRAYPEPFWAFFSSSRILFAPAVAPAGLLTPVESSHVVQRISNLAATAAATSLCRVDTGDVATDRGDVGVVVGILAYAGALAGVDLGCSCDGDASAAISAAPKDCDCDLRRAFKTPPSVAARTPQLINSEVG